MSIMRKVLIVLWWLNSCFLLAEKQPDYSENQTHCIRIYLCSRLTEEAKKWNNEVCQELKNEFCIFKPQDVDLSCLPAVAKDQAAYQADFEGMQAADLLLVLPPYGRDCAWEIGWFCGQQKIALAYAEAKGDWMADAMVKGGLTAIITNNSLLYEALLEDPSTREKCYLITSKACLAETIKGIYQQKISSLHYSREIFPGFTKA